MTRCSKSNASYAHGCRCEDCRHARNEYQRRKRGTKKPRAQKLPADRLAIWRERFGARS